MMVQLEVPNRFVLGCSKHCCVINVGLELKLLTTMQVPDLQYSGHQLRLSIEYIDN